MGVISVRGASEHNLKNISLDVPKNTLVAFTGISGSGKSSLVFDTLYAESFRRFLGAANLPSFLVGNAIEVRHSRPKVQRITGLPPALGLSQRQGVAGKLSSVGTVCGLSDLLRVYFAAFGDVYCRNCSIPLRPTVFADVLAHVLSRYSGKSVVVSAPIAEKRKGGFAPEIERFRQLGYSRLRVNGSVFDLQDEGIKISIDAKKLNTIDIIIDRISVSEEKRKRLERAISDAIEHGKGVVRIECGTAVENFNTHSACPQCGESSPTLDPRHFSHSSLGKCSSCEGSGAGSEGLSEDLFPCKSCSGGRLSAAMPIVKVCGATFVELHIMRVAKLAAFIGSVLAEHAGKDKSRLKVISEARRLSQTLVEVGVGHLNLNRAASSLVPGDLQRIRLASMMSNRLSGALYILDEPCQGLTAEEVESFVEVLRVRLKEGASVVVVEHHPIFLQKCDVVITLGPGAGVHGGEIVSINSSEQNAFVATAQAVNGVSKTTATFAELTRISFSDFRARELRLPKIEVYSGKVNLLRGPTGSGKNTFVEVALEPVLRSLLAGNPFGDAHIFRHSLHGNVQVKSVDVVRPGSLVRTSRRTVAAALDLLPRLRAIFALLPQAQLLGLTESHFSWSSGHGRCNSCDGKGAIELKQRFGPPVEVECDSCLGARLDSRSLVPRFKGKNFAEIMALSVEEARTIFANERGIEVRLAAACDFGLGYVGLGQSMNSLSGGELQRLLLTMQLRRSSLEAAWFILVHPGTGLHTPDIAVLGSLFSQMCAKGASFVIVENREEFLQFADSVIVFGEAQRSQI